MGKDADSRAGRRPDVGDEESNKMAVAGPGAERTMLIRYDSTEAKVMMLSSHAVAPGGRSGEVKRKTVNIWRAGSGGRAADKLAGRMGF
jgi:hypothetical protein